MAGINEKALFMIIFVCLGLKLPIKYFEEKDL
jgi:hypothetical protein